MIGISNLNAAEADVFASFRANKRQICPERQKGANYRMKIKYPSMFCIFLIPILLVFALSFILPLSHPQPVQAVTYSLPSGSEALVASSPIVNAEIGLPAIGSSFSLYTETGGYPQAPTGLFISPILANGNELALTLSPKPGVELLLASDDCFFDYAVQPVSFSWSPFKETTQYKLVTTSLVLAKDAAMIQVVKEVEVSNVALKHCGTLDYSANYFGQTTDIEPAPSAYSAISSFQKASTLPAGKTADKAKPTPCWVWVTTAISAILVIVTLVLIFKTRRI